MDGILLFFGEEGCLNCSFNTYICAFSFNIYVFSKHQGHPFLYFILKSIVIHLLGFKHKQFTLVKIFVTRQAMIVE